MPACNLKPITIYTDGSCVRNPGPGGWCAIITATDTNRIITKLAGRVTETTNNLIELRAVYEGLRATSGNVIVVSDSQMVINWLTGKARRLHPAIKEICSEIDRIADGRSVEYRWVRGHNGHVINELADTIARYQASLAANHKEA